MSHEEIAIALGLSRNTLEKHYEAELTTVAHERRLEVMNAQHRSALKGNVAAQKAYLAQSPMIAPPPVPTPEPEKLGKKAQRDVDATTAAKGTDWHDDLPRQGSTH
jgi:hypothetical protein